MFGRSCALVLANVVVVWGCSSGDGDAAAGNGGTGGSSVSAVGGGSGGAAELGGVADLGHGGTDGADILVGNGPTTQSCREATSVYHSGERLRVKQVVTSEGDASPLMLHDLERDEDCAFQFAADDTLRCLPSAATTFTGSSATFFADAACSDPVFAVSTGCPTKYLLVAEPLSTEPCGHARMRVYERGAVFTPNGAIYENSSGSCTEATPWPEHSLHRVGIEHPADAFAKAATGVWGAGRFGLTGIVGDDGSHRVDGPWDMLDGHACRPLSIAGGPLRCASVEYSASYFADSDCAMPLVFADQGCDMARPTYVAQYEHRCDRDPELLERLEPYTEPAYLGAPQVCSLASDTISEVGLVFGAAPALPDVLPAFEESLDADDPGRLTRSYLLSADGSCLFDDWYDRELDTKCRFELAQDGVYRCVPLGRVGPMLRAFDDPDCTSEVAYLELDGCEVPAVGALIHDDVPTACGTAGVVRPVLGGAIAPADMPVIYSHDGPGACAPLPKSEAYYLALGPPVEPSQLMGGEVSIE